MDGVIFVSWGSMVKATSLPKDKRESMVAAFGALKQRVLWKWENDTLPNKPANVRISRWLQQRDILCHPNVRVFVSHGGLLGSSEAAHCGVPVITTPMFGDQVSLFLQKNVTKQIMTNTSIFSFTTLQLLLIARWASSFHTRTSPGSQCRKRYEQSYSPSTKNTHNRCPLRLTIASKHRWPRPSGGWNMWPERGALR